MSTAIPSYSINYFTPLAPSTAASIGQVMIPDGSGGAFYVVSTTAARGTRRSEGVAISAWGGVTGSVGTIRIQQDGVLDASISGLGAGTASWVRCSATGTIERFTPVAAGLSDIIGKCGADGRVFLEFGVWTEDLAVGSGGGGAAAHVAGGPGDPQVRAVSGGDLDVPSFWTFGPNPALGNLLATYQSNSTNGGGITFRDAGGDTSGMPNIGTFRYSDQLADLNGLKSIAGAAYFRSSGGANVQQAVWGISGGRFFLGDASNPLTPIDFYAPAGAGAVTFVMGSSGFISMTGGNYASLGGAGKFLAIDNTGKVTVATPSGFTPPTGTGLVTVTGGVLDGASTSKVNPGGAASAMGALAIDWSLSNSFTKTLANSGNTITFSNVASGQTITVRLTGGGASSTVTWPTVKWKGGVAPTQTTSGIDVYTFWNDGTSTYGSVLQAMA